MSGRVVMAVVGVKDFGEWIGKKKGFEDSV
jgi:hypothetical protein